ncbi:MAG: histidinol dehydrogenase [Thermoanaerobaculia bacterium]
MNELSSFAVADAASRAGRQLVARVCGRFGTVLDRTVEREVRRTVRAVARGGGAGERALLAAVARYDDVCVDDVAGLALGATARDRRGDDLDGPLRDAIELAIANVERFHRRQLEQRVAAPSDRIDGLRIESLDRPLRRAGLYVPGGLASYPSTAIMTAVPARVAGVAEIVVATPAATYRRSPALRHTLARLGVEEIWGLGGAQAIAALALGCGPIRRVDVVAGPGNAWVTAAKREVAGRVAIDGLMGPSEVVVVATPGAPADWIAADLLAQAEHDGRASAILVTTSRALAREVAASVEARLAGLPTAGTACESLAGYGGALVVDSLAEAAALVERLAPEHLQLVGHEAEAAAEWFETAGAIFVGADCPEVLGDYVAGPSHVLPTCGAARFASGLSIATFRRTTHRLRVEPGEPASERAAASARLAEAEGLPAHAAAARLRVGVPVAEVAS